MIFSIKKGEKLYVCKIMHSIEKVGSEVCFSPSLDSGILGHPVKLIGHSFKIKKKGVLHHTVCN